MIKGDKFQAFRKDTGEAVCKGRVFTCKGLNSYAHKPEWYDAVIKGFPLPTFRNCKERQYQLFTRFFRFDIVEYASREQFKIR
jgi:hypothetical protein